jgi:hypothetical protein
MNNNPMPAKIAKNGLKSIPPLLVTSGLGNIKFHDIPNCKAVLSIINDRPSQAITFKNVFILYSQCSLYS